MAGRANYLDNLCNVTSRFEVTPWLFYDGPRNFEPRLDYEDDTSAVTFLSTLQHHTTRTFDSRQAERAPGQQARRIFGGIGFLPGNLSLRSRDLTTRPL
ncbi:hypothetical protein AVEN_19926-1, partial [Araneus ventricosus]